MGHTIACLNLSGNTSVIIERLKIYVSGLLISFMQYFSILLEIPSYPDEFLFLRDFIISLTSISVTGINFITGMLSG